MKKNIFDGFTLIELLVVISIIGILMGLSIFGLQGARTASRDAKRKTDLELVRSGLEIYKSDCNMYPVSNSAAYVSTVLATSGNSLTGDNVSSPACKSTNVYISQLPADPTATTGQYVYWSDGKTYELCSTLEKPQGSPPVALLCGASSTCGDTSTCYYKVTNP